MHEKVAAYLEQQREKEAAYRAKKLMELGLCQRVYMPEGTKLTADMAQEYPHEEDGRRFKVEPVSVTDEEWAAICGAMRQEYGFRRRNPVCRALWVLGFALYFLGMAAGLLAFLSAARFEYYKLALFQMLGIWFSAAVLGTLVLGQSEIIRLLERK